MRQTYRCQSISRKLARTNQAHHNDTSNAQNAQNTQNTSNIFEQNSHFVNNVLNRSVHHSNVDNESNKNLKNIMNSKMVSKRISQMRNYNKAVTRSEDYM